MVRIRKYLWGPLAVLLLIGGVYAANGLFPFGGSTISWCDMDQQVVPLLMDFKDILSGKAGLLYNLQNAGGMNFWGVFLFNLASPFSFLVAFVPKADFYLLMNVLVLLKMMCAAATATYLFHKLFPRLGEAAAAALSVMYACSGFVMLYYQILIWLDIVWLFPLFLAGLLRLLQDKKPVLFILSFSALLVVNFYLSYMAVLWLVLSAGVFCFFSVPRDQRGEGLLLLGFSTILVALLTAAVWLPALMQYLGSGRTSNLTESIASSSFTTPWETTLPILVCTSLAVTAVPLSLLTKRKSRLHEAMLAVFFLLLVPVFVEPVNKLWHTGNYQAFPARYGYILVLTGLVAAASTLDRTDPERLPAHTKREALVPCVLSVLLAAIVGVWLWKNYSSDLSAYTDTLWGDRESIAAQGCFVIIAAAAFFLLCYLYQNHILAKRVFCLLFCALACVEVVFNAQVYMASAANDGRSHSQITDLEGKIGDEDLYRVKMDKKYFDVNLIGALGYPSLSHYTSLMDGVYMKAMRQLGYAGYWMEIGSSGGTALTDALFGNRYSVVSTASRDNRETVYENSAYKLVRQPFMMPFGTVTPSLGNPLSDRNRFVQQNGLYRTVFGKTDDLFTGYSVTNNTDVTMRQNGEETMLTPQSKTASLIYRVPVEGTQTLYFDCYFEATNRLKEQANDACRILVNGSEVRGKYPTASYNGILELGTFTDELVEVRVELLHAVRTVSFGVYGMDSERLRSAIAGSEGARLQAAANGYSGTVTAQNGGYLFLPARGGPGFTAQVNGKAVEPELAFDAFLAVPLEKGENTVSITFLPPGFQTGTILTGLGFLLFLLLLWGLRKGVLARWHGLHRPALVCFTILWGAVFLALYIAPVLIWVTNR